MMISKMWYYMGPGKPVSSSDVHSIFTFSSPRVIVMSETEEEYLFALQLVHGVELNLIDFQYYHDMVWEHATTQGIDTHLRNVCCSHPGLTDLLMNRNGDLVWQRELHRQTAVEQRDSCLPEAHFSLNPRRRMFI